MKKYLQRSEKENTLAEMLLKHVAFFFFFLRIFNTVACKSIEGGRRLRCSKKTLNWYGFQRSSSIHFLSLEGTSEKIKHKKGCIKNLVNERRDRIVIWRN